jgi:hypothetical protein
VDDYIAQLSDLDESCEDALYRALRMPGMPCPNPICIGGKYGRLGYGYALMAIATLIRSIINGKVSLLLDNILAPGVSVVMG